MYRIYISIILCVIFLLGWGDFSYANLTLIEQLREQNTNEPVLERTYYDYDVAEVSFTYPNLETRVDVR